MNRRRHAAPAITALALLGLLLGAGVGAAKVTYAPKNRSLPRVSGSPFVGRMLVASHGRWTHRPRGYSFRWLACNAAGKRCRSIPHAKSTRYTLRMRELHARIRVSVRAWNRSGSGQAVSSATGMVSQVAEPAPPPPPGPPPPPLPPPPPSGHVVMVNDLGWAPTPNMPWNAITEDILFNLATERGPSLDASNISEINVPAWVMAAHAHRVEAFIAIGGAGNDNWGYACNATNRAQFVQNLVGFATLNGFNGIDLDIEDGPWSSQNPPVAAMTNCIIAVSNAAHAAGLLVTADVITNWQGPWYAPSQAYVDRYNLMTYGDNLAQMQQDVADTINQGLPASKFVVGIDVDEHPQPSGGCRQFANYAAQAGLMGTFVWDAIADYRAGNACMNGLAGG